MSVTTGYRIQVRNDDGAWASYTTDLASTYSTQAEASAVLTMIVGRAKPGVYDGRLRILEIVVTTKVVESVRETSDDKEKNIAELQRILDADPICPICGRATGTTHGVEVCDNCGWSPVDSEFVEYTDEDARRGDR